MPINKNLTDQQEQSLRDLLQQRFQERRAELVHELSRANDPDLQAAAHRVREASDEAVLDHIEGLELDLASRHLDQLRDLDRAWRRLSEGTVTECTDCGGFIEYDRLMAIPTTRRCVVCQEEYEHQFTAPTHTTY